MCEIYFRIQYNAISSFEKIMPFLLSDKNYIIPFLPLIEGSSEAKSVVQLC